MENLQVEKEVVVVIPIYKPTPNYFEIKSLIQCLKVLQAYNIYTVCPNNLYISNYEKLFLEKNIRLNILYFDEAYFEDINGYNKLMTSFFFYNSFIEYNFMLVYQLDAYIFKDELVQWCNKKYAYLGSSIPNHVLKYIEDKHIKDYSEHIDKSINFMNGGFSLRHIKTFLFEIENDTSVIKKYINMNWPEDIIFSFILNGKDYLIPDNSQSLQFSFESFPELAYKVNGNKLPTGCHGWYRDDFSVYSKMFWFKHIIPYQYYKIIFTNVLISIRRKFKYKIVYYLSKLSINV